MEIRYPSINRAREFTKSFKEKGDSKRLPTLVDSVASLRAEVLSENRRSKLKYRVGHASATHWACFARSISSLGTIELDRRVFIQSVWKAVKLIVVVPIRREVFVANIYPTQTGTADIFMRFPQLSQNVCALVCSCEERLSNLASSASKKDFRF